MPRDLEDDGRSIRRALITTCCNIGRLCALLGFFYSGAVGYTSVVALVRVYNHRYKIHKASDLLHFKG